MCWDKQTEGYKKVYIFPPSSLSSCVQLSACLLGKSGSWSWTAWRTIQKGQHKQTLEKMHLSSLPVSPREEDNNTCWRGLIFLKRWKAQATSTIAALVFHLFLSWPPHLSHSPFQAWLSLEAWVMVHWRSTWGDKDLQRNQSQLVLEWKHKMKFSNWMS